MALPKEQKTGRSRFERVINLFLTLSYSNKPLSMNELVTSIPGYDVNSDFEALRKNFERDKKILREQGVAITSSGSSTAAAAAYVIEASVPGVIDVDLDESEREALLLALSISRICGQPARDAVAKLASSIVDSDLEHSVRIPTNFSFALLRAAIRSRRTIGFIDHQQRMCEVEPYAIAQHDDKVVVVGRDRNSRNGGVEEFELAAMTSYPWLGSVAAFVMPPQFDPSTGPITDEVWSPPAPAAANRALGTQERLHRLFSVLSYLSVVGAESTDTLCARFQVRPEELLRDLHIAACCGIDPFTPDALLEVVADEHQIAAHNVGLFEGSSELTMIEIAAIVEAARVLLSVEGFEDNPDLLRAHAKLEALLEIEGEASVVNNAAAEWPIGWSSIVTLSVKDLSPAIERVMIGNPVRQRNGNTYVLALLADRRWQTTLFAAIGEDLEIKDVADDPSKQRGDQRVA